MARKSYSKSKNFTTYYIIEDYNRNGKRTTRILETIGKEKDIIELANKENMTLDDWINRYVDNYNSKHNISVDEEKVIIEKYSNTRAAARSAHAPGVGGTKRSA